VISTIALFLVLCGATAFAANQLGKKTVGAKQLKANAVTTAKIKKNAVTAKKIKKNAITTTKIANNSVTGEKVNEATLGTVPSATVANSLSTMTALKLTKTFSSASGATAEAAAAAATPVMLYEDSHFRIYGKCFVNSGGPEVVGVVYIATKQDGAIFDAPEDELSGGPTEGYLNVSTAEESRELEAESSSANNASINEASEFGATAADSYSLIGENQIATKSGTLPAGDGLYGPGDVCLFSGFVIHS